MTASKSGMTIGPKPKAGVDERPWEVYPEDDDTTPSIHTWYEETAEEVAKQRGWVYSQRVNDKGKPYKVLTLVKQPKVK